MELIKKDLKMTSREIAEITGKNHADVMRDIRSEIESLELEGLVGESIFALSSYKSSQGKDIPMFTMGREGAMQIATRYSAVIRRKLIIRLDELENATPKLPQTYAEALLEAGRLALELEQAKPKVEYYDKVLDTSSEFTTTQIAKELSMTARHLNDVLKLERVQFKQNNQWLLYKEYQNKGYTKTRTTIYFDSHGEEQSKHSTVWTERGRKFIHDLVEDL